MRSFGTILKGGLVAFVSVVVTTLGIDATDSFRTTDSLLGMAISSLTQERCIEGGVLIYKDNVPYCVDQYEAQVGETCPYQSPGALHETAENSNALGCVPVSARGALPWRFVSYTQAQQLCARAGKELISPEVWQAAALGTPDNVSLCALDTQLSPGGTHTSCVSGVGVYDMVGNVWEFVEGTVADGVFEEYNLPDSGYVQQVAANGVATVSTSTPDAVYGGDYIWAAPAGQYAMMRGGFYASRQDGGLYATHAAIETNFGSGAIGFRCMYRL